MKKIEKERDKESGRSVERREREVEKDIYIGISASAVCSTYNLYGYGTWTWMYSPIVKLCVLSYTKENNLYRKKWRFKKKYARKQLFWSNTKNCISIILFYIFIHHSPYSIISKRYYHLILELSPLCNEILSFHRS